MTEQEEQKKVGGIKDCYNCRGHNCCPEYHEFTDNDGPYPGSCELFEEFTERDFMGPPRFQFVIFPAYDEKDENKKKTIKIKNVW